MTTLTPPPPLTAAARKRLVEERKRRSLAWRVIHALGSLQLALVLLATITIAIGAATFYESAVSTKFAQAHFYKAPWFIAWLGLLCVNLFCVTLTRWPWQKKHTGFIVTHYGIILLLIGAVVGSKMGFEGNVTLHTDKPPVNRITTSHSVLQVESPSDGAVYLIPFDAETAQPSEKRPRILDIPGSSTKLVATGFSHNLLESESLESSAAPEAGPGAAIRFASATAAQDLSMAFALNAGEGSERDFFGLARIAFLPELPARETRMANESQMIFARFAPVVQGDGGSTGVSFSLSSDGQKVTATAPDGSSATYLRSEITDDPIQVGGATATLREYWPDFQIIDGRPATISPLPNNPAILVTVTGPAQAGTTGQPLLEMAPLPRGTGIRYQLSRDGIIYASGEGEPAGAIPLEWADWTAEVTTAMPRAAAVTTVSPGPESVEGVPGFFAQLRAPDGTAGPGKWIRSGSIETLALDLTVVRLGYGLEVRPVPFQIALKSFEVPRLEGTETPANFIATVEFTETATGATKGGVARMNHPASWPGDLFANLTGINYKFSQAEWNPQDLGETTLQVLYDPGWLLKWVGSLAICVGIFIMFYIRPKRDPRETATS